MSNNQIKLAIGVPAYGGRVSMEHARMWITLGRALCASAERFTLGMEGFVDVAGIDRARNILLAHAMRIGCDWLFTIDADTWVEAYPDSPVTAGEMILRMISDADRAGYAIVAGGVVRRSTDGLRGVMATRGVMAYKTLDEHGRYNGEMSIERFRTERALSTKTSGLVEVEAVATACIAMNLHKVNEANATFRFTDKLSEDLEFCRQMRAAGHRIALDTRVRTAHLSRAFPIYND